MTDEPTKRCAHCGEEKPVAEFHQRLRPGYTSTLGKRIKPTGLHSYCKVCNNGWRRIMDQRRAAAQQTR
jgi:hypothetical protein